MDDQQRSEPPRVALLLRGTRSSAPSCRLSRERSQALVPSGGRGGGRHHAHHNPMEDFVVHRRANYRQRTPRPSWRAIPDDAATMLFDALRSNRDRAIVSFYLSSGARASELLGLRHGDLDAGRYTITMVSKGSRLRETVPASVDSFVWLALYLSEQPPMEPGGSVWWTARGTPRLLNYHAMRAVLQRANASLGTNWTLHDFRHTAAGADACRPCLHPRGRADHLAARQHRHDADLHPAEVGRPGWQGARALRETTWAGHVDRAVLRRLGRSGTTRAFVVTNEVSRSNAQHQAVATRHAAGPSTRLLSRPDSPHLAAIPPDDRFGPAGKVLHVYGYDANQPPPRGTPIWSACRGLSPSPASERRLDRRPVVEVELSN
jgi:hypothetical protein